MKKRKQFSLVVILMLLAMVLAGCGDKSELPGKEPIAEELKVEDYFPIHGNTRFAYEGVGNEFAEYEIYVEYASGDKIQYRANNGGTVQARVVEIKDGKATRVFHKNEVYYRENMLDKRGEEEVLLMEPISNGSTWTLPDGRNRTITNIAAKVDTPLGSYEAIEVVTENDNDRVADYYAKDIGLVKSIFSAQGAEISSSLKSMEKNKARIENIPFYLPNTEDDKIYYIIEEVEFNTNDDTREVLEKAYIEIASDRADSLGKVFSPATKINKLTLNEENQVVLDLNQAFLSEMNAGAAYESMILQSIANTFSQYYGVSELLLTIDGKPFSSGHIEMKENEAIKAKLEGVELIEMPN